MSQPRHTEATMTSKRKCRITLFHKVLGKLCSAKETVVGRGGGYHKVEQIPTSQRRKKIAVSYTETRSHNWVFHKDKTQTDCIDLWLISFLMSHSLRRGKQFVHHMIAALVSLRHSYAAKGPTLNDKGWSKTHQTNTLGTFVATNKRKGQIRPSQQTMRL